MCSAFYCNFKRHSARLEVHMFFAPVRDIPFCRMYSDHEFHPVEKNSNTPQCHNEASWLKGLRWCLVVNEEMIWVCVGWDWKIWELAISFSYVLFIFSWAKYYVHFISTFFISFPICFISSHHGTHKSLDLPLQIHKKSHGRKRWRPSHAEPRTKWTWRTTGKWSCLRS
jgi:hypothetical protein